MARPSDREFILKRKVKELEEQNNRLEMELARLKKQLEKNEPIEKKPSVKVRKNKDSHECPSCGAPTKLMVLPHAVLELCSSGCGYRRVGSR